MTDLDRFIETVAERSRERFRAAATVISFDEYLTQLRCHPYRLSRNASQYMADMMDWFGTETIDGVGGPIRRYQVFDDPTGDGEFRVFGQEDVQNDIYRALREFVQRRRADKMILLHGPNGSSKTSIVAALVRGLEAYSRTDDGALYRVNWVFSEAVDRGDRLGFNPVLPEEDLDSFAHLPPDRVSAKIPLELHDDPLLLLPAEDRRGFLRAACEEQGLGFEETVVLTDKIADGSLSPKSWRIYSSLLASYAGDWAKVLRHVQVERFVISRRYRTGAVTIEPQANTDAHSRQIGHPVTSGLPPVLQNEPLFEAAGDLVDANRGVVEYSDFLKRPMEANKYLLTTAEHGVINLPSYTAELDCILIGTSNEIYLSAFRRDPLFDSFKSRLELVRVAYLLHYEHEAEIYDRHLAKLPADMCVAPHTTRIAALWAVMTRLMTSAGEVGDDRLRPALTSLTPIEKARLYAHGEVPERFSDDVRSLLRFAVPQIRAEYDTHEVEFEGKWDIAYEGRRGCSAREMLTLLSEVALDASGGCVTPLVVIRALPSLVRDPSRFGFLRQQRSKTGFHDCEAMIATVTIEYARLLSDDVQEAAQLVDPEEYGRLFERYFLEVKAFETHEKVVNEKTGRAMPPDEEFMASTEKMLGVDDPDAFRSHLMTRIAAFRLEHPDAPLVYDDLFRDLLARLRRSFFQHRMQAIERIVGDTLVLRGARAGTVDAEREAAAREFDRRMIDDLGYCDFGLVEVLSFFLDHVDDV